ncbi:hypothetical protein [Thermocoleostomius sinensis]|uniref:Uncharacterized protein n=1 Tax=Thermocoleostomius sinensis A174 TaxID=2016057 RepID=A0A9E9C8M2_9CYAN|nr:hypothetical protein [Thermocoleostomius sinensis]WAL61564.1 hypothetical protein OXH18_06145 [Thermocoleostomius sinensis A174]
MSQLPQSSDQFLTPEECAEVDATLMPARDRFTARVSIYSLRSLKQIAQAAGITIDTLTEQQIIDWVEQDPTLRPEDGFDPNFKRFFARLVISSLRPLKQIAQEADVAIEALTLSQVVSWFEKEAKARIDQGEDSTFQG